MFDPLSISYTYDSVSFVVRNCAWPFRRWAQRPGELGSHLCRPVARGGLILFFLWGVLSAAHKPLA